VCYPILHETHDLTPLIPVRSWTPICTI